MRNNTIISNKTAICYSGFRDGQRPGEKYPSYDEVKEDLLLLHNDWNYLRLYDCDYHAELVLKVIQDEKMNFQVMLGTYIEAELNNPACPWGGVYPEETLKKNKENNLKKIERLIHLANKYPSIVIALSVGNEACVDWTDHLVSTESVAEYVRIVKKNASQPVTFCDNYVPWITTMEEVAKEVDFISIHTYPIWEYKNIDTAMAFTIENLKAVSEKYPHKQIVITEAGWTTKSNGRGINECNASNELQKIYLEQLLKWSKEENILVFVFEAFDENWKGSSDPNEPEKHWGIFYSNRTPKLYAK